MTNQDILNNIFQKDDGLYYTQYEEEIFGCLNIKLATGIYDDNITIRYYKDGNLHREDGPAIINSAKCYIRFYYKGKYFRCKNTVEFKKKIKLLAFI